MKKIFLLMFYIFICFSIWQFGFWKGIKDGRNQITIEDVCLGMEPAGFSANFETGISYDWIKCRVNLKYNTKVEDVFEIEGGWEKCDSNGENCIPVNSEEM
jgi:hypothetical protein